MKNYNLIKQKYIILIKLIKDETFLPNLMIKEMLKLEGKITSAETIESINNIISKYEKISRKNTKALKAFN